MKKSARRFSKMENSIQLLSPGMSERNMAENSAGISKKSTHPCRKKAEPTYALIDFQSTKTASANEGTGYDGGKNKRKKTAYRDRYYNFSRRLSKDYEISPFYQEQICIISNLQTLLRRFSSCEDKL